MPRAESFNPRGVSRAELGRVTRRFFHALGGNIGPDYDIPAPDVGTNAQTMAWALDTYMNTVGMVSKQAVLGVVTGKPVSIGGTPAAKSHGPGPRSLRAALGRAQQIRPPGQEADPPGLRQRRLSRRAAARTDGRFARRGPAIAPGTSPTPKASTPTASSNTVEQTGSIAGYPNGNAISRDDFFSFQADLFVPAALENQVGPSEAEALQVRLVAEGANGPCSPEGEDVLKRRGIEILPDVLANAGGVTVSYYEWVQNRRSEQWTLEDVDDRLERAMLDAYSRMDQYARNKHCDNRLACYAVALERLTRAYIDREIFP